MTNKLITIENLNNVNKYQLTNNVPYFRLIVALQVQLDASGCVAQSVARLTQEPEVPDSIPGPATSSRFSFRVFNKESCQLLAKECARSTG